MKFELKPNIRSLSNDDLILEIKRIDSLLNKEILTLEDFNKHSKISSDTIRHRFSSWQNALSVSGLQHKFAQLPMHRKIIGQKLKKLTEEQIIEELKRIANFLNRKIITIDDLRKNSKIMSDALVRRRFGSWELALKRAGLEISPMGKRHSLEDYFENMLEVWTFHGRQPFYREMDEPPSKITSGGYEARFGSWREALEAFVDRMNNEEKGVAENPTVEEIPKKTKKIILQEERVLKSSIVRSEDRRGITLSLRYKVLVRGNFKCVRCGRNPATNPGVELHVDHIVPFSKGGKTTLDNLETKCKECNLGKGNRYSE